MPVLVGGGRGHRKAGRHHGEGGRHRHGSRRGGGRRGPSLRTDIHVRGDIPDHGVHVDTGDGHKFNALHGHHTVQVPLDGRRRVLDILHWQEDVGGGGGLQLAGAEAGAVGLEVSPQAEDEGLPLVADPQVLVKGRRRGQGAGVEEVEEVGGGGGHLG